MPQFLFLPFSYSSRVRLRKPFGVMVSSPDQTPQVPFMFFLIIHYFERPAPSVRLVKSIHLRALPQYGLSMNCNRRWTSFVTVHWASTSSCWAVKFLCKHEICPDLAWRVNCSTFYQFSEFFQKKCWQINIHMIVYRSRLQKLTNIKGYSSMVEQRSPKP